MISNIYYQNNFHYLSLVMNVEKKRVTPKQKQIKALV